MSKKKPKTYNHYVSQFYLKKFSGNDSIGRYNFARILANQGKIEISNGFIESLNIQIDRPNLSYIQGMIELIPIISDLYLCLK